MHITHRRRFGAGRPARVIAVSAVIAVGLVGCSGGSEESGPEESGPAVEEEEIVLDFPSWQVNEPGNGDVLRAIVDEFESRHDNVTVNLYYVSNDDFQNTLVTRLASGNPPDVIASGNHFYAFAATGQLESLTSRLEESGLMDTWQQSLLDGTTYDGEILSLPLHAHSRMMYYNTDYFAQAGIDAPPTTPEELEADVEALAALGLEGVSPWGATTTSHSNLFGESNAFVLGMGGGWIKDGEWAVTSPETVAALELYRTLTKQAPPATTAASTASCSRTGASRRSMTATGCRPSSTRLRRATSTTSWSRHRARSRRPSPSWAWVCRSRRASVRSARTWSGS